MWSVVTPPPITKPEIERLVRKLWRFAMRETFKGTIKLGKMGGITIDWRGNTYGQAGSRMYKPTFQSVTRYVAFVCAQIEGGEPDTVEHLMVREVLKRGYLDGRLKDPPSQPTTKEERAKQKRDLVVKRIKVRITTWSSKRKRAENALKKLTKQLKRLEQKK